MMRTTIYAVMLTAALAACSDQSDAPRGTSPEADTGGTAVVALTTDLDYANILAANDRYTQEVLRYVLFLPLVQYDSALGYEPALARSYELEGDSAVTFKLRDDVLWHD